MIGRFSSAVYRSSGDALLLDTKDMPFSGEDVLFGETLVGHDSVNDLVWFRGRNSPGNTRDKPGYIRFHFFEYDRDTRAFTVRSVRDAPASVGRNDMDPIWWTFIHGDYILYTRLYFRYKTAVQHRD